MSDNIDADSKDFRTIAMIIDTLEEHEQSLDKSLDRLAGVIEQVDGFNVIMDRLLRVEQKLNALQEDIKGLSALLSTN